MYIFQLESEHFSSVKRIKYSIVIERLFLIKKNIKIWKTWVKMRSEGVDFSILFTNIVLTSNNYIKYDIMIETDFHMDWYPETNFIHSMIPRNFEKHTCNCNMHAWNIFQNDVTSLIYRAGQI